MKLLIALLIVPSIALSAPKLKYNYMTKEWHYATEDAVVTRNYMNGKWELAPKNAQLVRNPTTKSYEYVTPTNDVPYNTGESHE